MNKPKLNQPDVETTTTTTTTLTTFNSTTRESITINQTIPSRQFKDVFVTGTTVEECIYTKEEIKKEWEKLGYEWGDGKNCLDLFKEDEVRLGFAKTIRISFVRKNYSAVYEENMYDEECYTCVPCDITFQEHNLLTKTFKMLGWEDSND